MIGNISVAGNANQLNYLINLRTNYIQGQVTAYQQKLGDSFKPNKLKIIVIDDMSTCGEDYIIGSILLPNTRALIYLTEGDNNGFAQEYIRKLEDPNVQEYIVVLLAGLVERNFDYIFYFNNDDPIMIQSIASVLFNYLYQKFGIIVYDVLSNPATLGMQSIDTNRFMEVQNLIYQYKISNRQPSLFQQF